MAKYLFTFWPFAGHIYPAVAVARGLHARGHEIAFYTGKQGCVIAGREGYACFPFKRIDEEPLYDQMFSRDFYLDPWRHPRQVLNVLRSWLIRTVPSQIEDLEQVLSEWEPDIIVSDPAMWGPILILHELKQIPVSVLCYLPGCMIPGPEAPLYGLGLPRPHDLPTRLLSGFTRVASDLFLANSRRTANELRRRYGLDPVSVSVAEYTGKMPLYMVTSSPELDYERQDLPSSVEYVGPCSMSGAATTLPSTLDAIPPDQPWILVSEGTLHTQRPFMLQAAAQGLANLPLQVIITTGRERTPSDLGLNDTAPNVHVEQFVPYGPLLPKIDLMVTTGGAGTVLAALEAGIPLVVVPTEWDKLENAQRVVEAGAGVRLSPSRCTPQRLRQAVQKVLSDESFKKNARRIGDSFKEYQGVTRAAELLEDLAGVSPVRARDHAGLTQA